MSENLHKRRSSMRTRGFGVSPADRLLNQPYALVKTSSITPLIRERTNNLYPVGFSLFETTDKNDLDVNIHIKRNSFICQGETETLEGGQNAIACIKI